MWKKSGEIEVIRVSPSKNNSTESHILLEPIQITPIINSNFLPSQKRASPLPAANYYLSIYPYKGLQAYLLPVYGWNRIPAGIFPAFVSRFSGLHLQSAYLRLQEPSAAVHDGHRRIHGLFLGLFLQPDQ